LEFFLISLFCFIINVCYDLLFCILHADIKLSDFCMGHFLIVALNMTPCRLLAIFSLFETCFILYYTLQTSNVTSTYQIQGFWELRTDPVCSASDLNSLNTLYNTQWFISMRNDVNRFIMRRLLLSLRHLNVKQTDIA